MPDDTRLTLSTRVDRNGRIVLPAAARRALGVATGDLAQELIALRRQGLWRA